MILQQTAKSTNQAESKATAANAGDREELSKIENQSEQPVGIWHRFRNLPVQVDAVLAIIQPKLTINHPDDPFEQEADRMAEQVMRMSESNPSGNPASLRSNQVIQRKCTTCGGELEEEHEDTGETLMRKAIPHTIQRKCAACEATNDEENHTLMRKAAGIGGYEASPSLSNQLNRTKGGGAPLPESTRSVMENAFQTDFSRVRIHTDTQAAEMSRGIQARAFTHGQNIYFNRGEFAPGSGEGKRLLAHELAHTIQQGSGTGVIIQRQAQAPEPTKKRYPIRVPHGTTSWDQFRRYAEVRIFGEVKNIDWHQIGSGIPSSEAYQDIEKYIGKIITFRTSYSAPPSALEEKKELDEAYKELGSSERTDTNKEIDARYFESEGGGSGQIKSNETGKAAIWNSFKRQVMAEKAKLDNLPPAVKEFLQSDKTFTPENYAQLARIADLLNQFNTADFLDYKGKVNFETTDLEELRQSLQQYLDNKLERQVEAEKRETIKTKLYGLEGLYYQYKRVKSLPVPAMIPMEIRGDHVSPQADKRRSERIREMQASNKAEQDSFNSNLKANGFSGISEFEQYIKDYESAFEKETIAIAEDLLRQYRHHLFEEEKKINSDAYITALFDQLSSSGAKEQFESADSKESIAAMILPGDPGKYTQGERELKSQLRSEASSERVAGNAAISALPSRLVKEEGFDRESLASVGSKEELKSKLLSYIEEKRGSITETWENIHANPEHIYELDKLFATSIAAQGIEKNSIFDLILTDKAAEINKYKILKAVCFIVLTVALTIATFGTAGPLAIAAGVASVGMSIYGVYEAIEDYKRNNAANDVGLLTDDPSLVWVVLAIGGAVIDVAALSAALKAAKPISDAAKAFNEGAGAAEDLTKLEDDLKKIAELSEDIRKNIVRSAEAEAKAKQALKSLVVPDGKLRMVIVLGGEEFAKIVVAAYQFAKKGVLDFSTFLKELKAAQLIDDLEKLTASEKLILKEAFEKGKSLTKADVHLASEIEKAVADGDFVILQQLINSKTAVKGSIRTLSHEYRQARSVGDLLGGGEFNFIDSKKGIEGFLRQADKEIPVSLKEFTTDNVKNIFREIRDNAKAVQGEAVADSKIVIGMQPNTVMYTEITKFDKAAILKYIEESSTNILPPNGVFERVIFKTSDGSVFTIPFQ